MEHLFYAFVLLIVAASHVEAAPPVRPPETCTEYGVDSPTCTANVLGGLGSLQRCIQASFPNDCGFTEDTTALVTVDRVPKCTYYYDGENYAKARAAAHGDNLPFAVMYAESEDDAVKFLNCAVQNGYPVSARGRGHSYQGLSTMHGHVIIDMSLTCKPDEFVIDRTGGDHILPGQRYLATIQVQPGCTNAVMLAAAYKNFTAEEGALALIGSCPSVGITGFLLGGGTGDVAPYTGWMVDLLEEARVILYNGTVVTTSREENPDLFWALRGGGSGNGIVSSLTLRIVQAPEPTKPEESRKVTYFNFQYDPAIEKRYDILEAIQNFLYVAEYTSKSSKFGGNGKAYNNSIYMEGIYLGSAEEMIRDATQTGLLNDTFFDDASLEPTFLVQDYLGVCGTSIGLPPCDIGPERGFKIFEFDSYGEAEAFKICYDGLPYTPSVVRGTVDWCDALSIETQFCEEESLYDYVATNMPFLSGLLEINDTAKFYAPKCYEKEVVLALLEVFGEPESFVNRHGFGPVWNQFLPQSFFEAGEHPFGLYPGGFSESAPLQLGGFLSGSVALPKVDVNTLVELSISPGIDMNHLQHGAPLSVPLNTTALPLRDTAVVIDFEDDFAAREEFVSKLVKDPRYGDDASKIQGYYNYLGPQTPLWRTLYFGSHYEKLSLIRGGTDPVGIFDTPLSVEVSVK